MENKTAGHSGGFSKGEINLIDVGGDGALILLSAVPPSFFTNISK